MPAQQVEDRGGGGVEELGKKANLRLPERRGEQRPGFARPPGVGDQRDLGPPGLRREPGRHRPGAAPPARGERPGMVRLRGIAEARLRVPHGHEAQAPVPGHGRGARIRVPAPWSV